MDSHELARLLLSKPPLEVVVRIGEDSRDNPSYSTVCGAKEVFSNSLGEISDSIGEEKAILLTHEGIL